LFLVSLVVVITEKEYFEGLLRGLDNDQKAMALHNMRLWFVDRNPVARRWFLVELLRPVAGGAGAESRLNRAMSALERARDESWLDGWTTLLHGDVDVVDGVSGTSSVTSGSTIGSGNLSMSGHTGAPTIPSLAPAPFSSMGPAVLRLASDIAAADDNVAADVDDRSTAETEALTVTEVGDDSSDDRKPAAKTGGDNDDGGSSSTKRSRHDYDGEDGAAGGGGDGSTMT
jgi:hypothetical protein